MRKKREPKLPGNVIITKSGMEVQVKRTSKKSSAGLWLYRLEYPEVCSKSLWTRPQLLEMAHLWENR